MLVPAPEQTLEQTNLLLRFFAAIERRVVRLRILAILIVLINLALLAFAIYSYTNFQHLHLTANGALLFVFLLLVYAALSGTLIINLWRTLYQAKHYQATLQDVLQNYQRRTDELQVAAQIVRDASLGVSSQEILQKAADLISERFGFYHVGIFLVEEKEGQRFAEIKAAAGTDASQELLDYGHALPIKEGSIIGHVIANAKARIVLDVRQDEQHFANPHLPATRSELAVPLCIGQRVLGALDVQSRFEGAFTQQDVTILQTLADLLAVAIDKAQLHQQVQSYADDLELRVNERTKELTAERAQLNAILDSMVEGVMYYEGTRLIYTNKAFQHLVGYSERDWAGFNSMMTVQGLSPAEVQEFRDKILASVEKEGIWHGEMKLRRRNASEFDALVTSVHVDNGSTIRKGIVTIIRDISQEKALQEQQNRFVAYASHELRTPLANMKTQMYLLKKQPQKFDHHYGIVKEVIDRMQRLVDDLLSQSRFERGLIHLKRQVMPLRDIVQSIADLQAPEAAHKQIRLSSALTEQPCLVSVDHDRITQVITNLVSNAINYTDEGGEIRIGLVLNGGEHVDIVVEDTGIGIPPDKMDLIFQPFFRAENTTAKGTGLGLNIAKQIVELHEGQIFVQSELNKGSVFTVRLKLEKEAKN